MKILENGEYVEYSEEKIKELFPIFPPAQINMEDERRKAFTEAMRYGNAITAVETSQWADVEPLSWEQQRAEALTVRTGGTLDDAALLPGLAHDKGVPLADYAEGVWQNAIRYSAILRAAVRLRRMAEGLLSDDLDTPEKLAAAVAALKIEADATAAELIQ